LSIDDRQEDALIIGHRRITIAWMEEAAHGLAKKPYAFWEWPLAILLSVVILFALTLTIVEWSFLASDPPEAFAPPIALYWSFWTVSTIAGVIALVRIRRSFFPNLLPLTLAIMHMLVFVPLFVIGCRMIFVWVD
jgi:hypothetical protein